MDTQKIIVRKTDKVWLPWEVRIGNRRPSCYRTGREAIRHAAYMASLPARNGGAR